MYAIFEHKDKQYKVTKGDVIKIPKQADLKKGDKMNFEKVLFLKSENGDLQIGSPLVKDCMVEAEIIEQIRDKKIIVFKKKRRHNYRRKIGHRQDLTLIKIANVITKNVKKLKAQTSTEKASVVKEDQNGS